MAFLEDIGISEGLQVFLLALALLLAIFFLIRYLSFYYAYRRIRKENVEMASELKKRLKTAKLRSLDEIMDEQEDEMFRKPTRAKPLVIPATYEARVSRTRDKVLKKSRRKSPSKRARKARPRKRMESSV